MAKPQPAITTPLQKRDRALMVGDEAAGQPEQGSGGARQQPEQSGGARQAQAAESPAPEASRKPSGRSRPGKRTSSPSEGDSAAAGTGSEAERPDPLLASLLAGRSPARGIPITRLDPELHGTLRLISARSGVPIQELVNGAVRQWLSDNQRRLIDAGVLEG